MSTMDMEDSAVKASLIVRSSTGKLLHVADPVCVDDESVRLEVRRLREIFGNAAQICTDQVVYARQAMERESLVA
jgi:hypothetical protein